MYATCASLFEYAFYQSVEFCSISYKSSFSSKAICASAHNATHHFLQSLWLHPTPPRSSLFHIVQSLPQNAISCRKEFQAHNGTPWRILPSIKSSPERIRIYIPPTPAPLCCKCPKYCLLVVFHAAMYFSMQLV